MLLLWLFPSPKLMYHNVLYDTSGVADVKCPLLDFSLNRKVSYPQDGRRLWLRVNLAANEFDLLAAHLTANGLLHF